MTVRLGRHTSAQSFETASASTMAREREDGRIQCDGAFRGNGSACLVTVDVGP